MKVHDKELDDVFFIDDESLHGKIIAMVNGKSGIHKQIPLYTNFCYSNAIKKRTSERNSD